MMKHYKTLYVELYDKRAALIRRTVREDDILLFWKIDNLDKVLAKLDIILGYNL